MITEDYVSFETAKLLKEKGFDESTNSQYPVHGIHYGEVGEYNITDRSRNPENYIPAPTLQMAMKWFEEVHNILLITDYDYECADKSWCYKIYQLEEGGKPKRVPIEGVRYDSFGEPHVEVVAYRDYERSFADYATKKEACEVAIKYCLENLI